MSILVPREAAQRDEVVMVGATPDGGTPGETNSMTNFIGHGYDGRPVGRDVQRGPQAFLAEIGEEYTIHPHYHEVDQYQIFVNGDGRIGKDDLSPVTVHYVDSYTPYGPIVCTDAGMAFFNLRARGDVGAHWMPGARTEMLRHAGRHRTSRCELLDPAEAGPAVRTSLIEPEPDGLCAFATLVGPGLALPADTAGGAGRYELVLRGSVDVEGEELVEHSLLFAESGERLPPRRAGAGGAQVLTVQLPTV